MRNFQDKELCIAPEYVKVILLFNNAPAHQDAEWFVSADGCISIVFLPPNTTAVIQPMDRGDNGMQTFVSEKISG